MVSTGVLPPSAPRMFDIVLRLIKVGGDEGTAHLKLKSFRSRCVHQACDSPHGACTAAVVVYVCHEVIAST